MSFIPHDLRRSTGLLSNHHDKAAQRDETRDYHGKGRLTEKNDAALPPTDASAIQAVTPSDIFSWQGPTEPLTRSSARVAAEQKWYAVTGRVVEVRAEAGGDVHIALQDVTGDNPGTVVVELPAKPQCCGEIQDGRTI